MMNLRASIKNLDSLIIPSIGVMGQRGVRERTEYRMNIAEESSKFKIQECGAGAGHFWVEEKGSRLRLTLIVCPGHIPNHYHLLLQTTDGNLYRWTRHINGACTQRFKQTHNFT